MGFLIELPLKHLNTVPYFIRNTIVYLLSQNIPVYPFTHVHVPPKQFPPF